MSNTISNSPETTSLTHGLVEALISEAIFYFSAVRRHVRRAQSKKALRSLSDEQLKDAGIDRSLIHTGPGLEVDARLMNILMSLR